MEQVLNFFFEVNAHKHQKSARILPRERESCYTLLEHLTCVEKRLWRLEKIGGNLELDGRAALLVGQKMTPLWHIITQNILTQAPKIKIFLKKPIHLQDRCLTHSDVGFHNAIRTREGKLRFIDFEYAGWGDPAKMVCDFFSAPKVPVTMKHFNGFTEAIASQLKEPEQFLARVKLLLPLYRLKWCCILMNDFLPVGQSRRHFALGKSDKKIQQEFQLQKVEDSIEKLSQELDNGLY